MAQKNRPAAAAAAAAAAAGYLEDDVLHRRALIGKDDAHRLRWGDDRDILEEDVGVERLHPCMRWLESEINGGWPAWGGRGNGGGAPRQTLDSGQQIEQPPLGAQRLFESDCCAGPIQSGHCCG